MRAFLSDAFADYIAARMLLLGALPKQAAILSSTALEKCFKAMLAFQGNESHGHLKKAHWNAVRNFDRALFAKLNPDFVELNRRAYLLRYTEDLPADFNLVIASREFLAELDYTVHAVQSAFAVIQGGKERELGYASSMARKDARLLSENHVLGRREKEEFVFAKPQNIYEVRNDRARGLLEATYYSQEKPAVAGFLRPAWRPKDGKHMSYDLSHTPLGKAPP